ncbi:hypothetical protein [Stutzerimonas balearica]|uniref:hypothetical protein n=1 Tax=Stutzerimonas balearica TaxID=74829 RepID=UPI0028A1484E|nr:hypothetical protein [Stutzerimonas balearica]
MTQKVSPILIIGMLAGVVLSFFLLTALLVIFTDSNPALPPNFFTFLKDVIGPVAAGFGGAIAGAASSYYMQQHSEANKETKKRELDYNSGLSVIAAKINDLASTKAALIIPYQHNRLRFIEIPALPAGEPISASAEQCLGHILITLGKAQLMMKLNLAEQRYRASVWNLAERSRYIQRYREDADKHASGNRRTITLLEISEITGLSRLIRLYNFTEQMIAVLDEAIISLKEIMLEIQKECSPLLKKEGCKIILLTPEENESLERTPPPFFENADQIEESIKGHAERDRLALRDWRLTPYEVRR